MLGYVFNPVSFYYCYRPDGSLACMVAEVSNTFGEMLPYLLSTEQRLDPASPLAYTHEKRLHVSPFFELAQEYRFFFSEPGERVHARVDVWQDGERRLGSVLAGERQELSNASLAQALVRYPLLTARVTGLIHWQALKLLAKRVPFHHKPPFVPGRGSVRRMTATAAPAASRFGLPPAPPRAGLERLARATVFWALEQPRGGLLLLTLPDGSRRRFGDPAAGPTVRATIVRSRTSSGGSRPGARSASATATSPATGGPTTCRHSSSS